MKLSDVKVKISPSKQTTGTVAYVKISFSVEIEGRMIPISIDSFRIMTSQFQAKHGTIYKLLPPAIYSKQRYKDVIFFEDKDFWSNLESYVIRKFEETMVEQQAQEATQG